MSSKLMTSDLVSNKKAIKQSYSRLQPVMNMCFSITCSQLNAGNSTWFR